MSQPVRILVVDDDPALRDLLCAYLSDTGFAVDLAADGAAMRQAMQRGLPDAIVLDLMLPGDDGLTLTRELRAQQGPADSAGASPHARAAPLRPRAPSVRGRPCRRGPAAAPVACKRLERHRV
jgi:CheY-like chemotaxis protein